MGKGNMGKTDRQTDGEGRWVRRTDGQMGKGRWVGKTDRWGTQMGGEGRWMRKIKGWEMDEEGR